MRRREYRPARGNPSVHRRDRLENALVFGNHVSGSASSGSGNLDACHVGSNYVAQLPHAEATRRFFTPRVACCSHPGPGRAPRPVDYRQIRGRGQWDASIIQAARVRKQRIRGVGGLAAIWSMIPQWAPTNSFSAIVPIAPAAVVERLQIERPPIARSSATERRARRQAAPSGTSEPTASSAAFEVDAQRRAHVTPCT